jgi:hypothetical protein
MASRQSVTVRLFGCLHTLRRQRGLPAVVEVELPAEGLCAEELAGRLELPLELVEAVLVNRKAYSLRYRVRPGDRVAFVPRGTPGPHRFTLGIYGAGTGQGRDSS